MGDDPKPATSILDALIDVLTHPQQGYLLVQPPLYWMTVTVVFVGLYVAARKGVTLWSGQFEQTTKRYHVQKWGVGVVTFVFLGLLIYLWMPKAEKFWQFLGLLGAGLAVALTGPITNLAGWVFILIRKPFSVKDRIQVGKDIAGDVIDISLFQFSLIEIGNWVDADQSTGRIVHVPNALVFSQQIANYTQGFQFIWNEIPVTITFESNWEKAHQLLTDLLERFTADVETEARKQMREASSRFMVYYTRLTPIVWLKGADIGVTLTLRYLCEARRRRGSETMLWMEILRAVALEHDIDFAYPTTRFYDNHQEGKAGAGGPPMDALEMVDGVIPELSEMTMSIDNLQHVYAATKAEVVLPGDEESGEPDVGKVDDDDVGAEMVQPLPETPADEDRPEQ